MLFNYKPNVKTNELDYNDLIRVDIPLRKCDLMEYVFTASELKNIDASIPIDLPEYNDSFLFVMDYNNSVFGRLVNMLELAYERNKPLCTPLYSYNQF